MNIYILTAELVLLLVPVGMLILEVFLSFNNIKGDTISQTIQKWAYDKNYFITLAWGIVTGHLFLGSANPVLVDNTMSVVVVALLTVATALIGCATKLRGNHWLFQLCLLIAGTGIGHLIWSMNDFN